MRRLRALLAGRPQREVVSPSAPGEVGRRRLLALLATSPIALPAVVQAAARSSGVALGLDVQRAGLSIGSAAIFDAEGKSMSFVAQPWLYPTDLSSLTYDDFRVTSPDSVMAHVSQERLRRSRLGLDVSMGDAIFPFTDDVGSGP